MATIEVGEVIEEWTPDEGEPCELCAYVKVEVKVDGKAIGVGTMIGVPEWQHGTARAAQADVRPFCTAWWADASDHQDMPSDLRDDVQAILAGASYRLLRSIRDV